MTAVEVLVNGVSLGATYTLIVLGFVVLFKASDVVNFAHGTTVLLGAYTVAELHTAVGFWAAVAIGIVVAMAVNLLIERLLVRAMRGGAIDALAVMTIGVNVILATELSRRLSSDVLVLGDPWQDRVVTIGGIVLPVARLYAMGIGAVLITGFLLALRLTNWGVSMRAAAENQETSELMGIRLGRVSMSAWLIAGLLATVAGVFLSVFPSAGVTSGLSETALAAFPAAILGGLDSIAGAIVGGLVIGIAQTVVVSFQSELAFLGSGFNNVVPYLLMIAVLLWRPSGLLGTRDFRRV